MVDADFRLLVVWTNTIKSDDAAGAGSAAALFDDPRVRQFHDPERRVGRLFAPLIEMPSLREVAAARGVEPQQLEQSFGKGYVYGEAAVFDTVFFFPPGVEWGDAPPEPAGWVTQLDPAMFLIDAERFRFGEAMGDEMARLADLLFERQRKERSAEPIAGERVLDYQPSSLDLESTGGRLLMAFSDRAPEPGAAPVRVFALTADEGFEQQAALTVPDADLGDPRLAAAPDGRLLLLCTASGPASAGAPRSLIASSSDGATWTEPRAPSGLPEGARVVDLVWGKKGVLALVELASGAALYRSSDGHAYEHASDFQAPPDSRAEALVLDADQRIAALFTASERSFLVGEGSRSELACGLAGARLFALPGGKWFAGMRDAQREVRLVRIAPDGTCKPLPVPGSAGPGGVALAEHKGELWIVYAAEGPDVPGLHIARLDPDAF